jgi:RND family efflux transporter MFP subunit
MTRTSTSTRLLTTAALTAMIGLGTACGHRQDELQPTVLSPIKVTVVTADKTAARKPIEVYGVVQPSRQAAVSSRVMGPVVATKVDAGDTVNRGQELLTIQPEAVEGQVAQAKGALAQARAGLALAERNFQRFEALHGEGAASEVELDMARMQLEQARGAVEQAEGAVQAASSVADEAVVRAPFHARVVDTLVEVGDLAAPGRPLVRVESFGGRQIWLSVRAADIQRVGMGETLRVRLDSRPDLGTVNGTVDEIVPSADPATHTFTVRVGLEGIDVPSGLSGRAELPGDMVERLLVPAGAVHARGGLELVVVRAEDGTARTRAVTTGAGSADGRIEILSGLDEGEQVVVDAPGPVADGTPLEVRS